MNYRDNELLNWFQSIPFTNIVEIYPNSNLLVLTGNDMQNELMDLEADWNNKSTEEKEQIKLNVTNKNLI
jgi:hypothetical protein